MEIFVSRAARPFRDSLPQKVLFTFPKGWHATFFHTLRFGNRERKDNVASQGGVRNFAIGSLVVSGRNLYYRLRKLSSNHV
jgi:hypothetical protein